ncbi:MAG: bifunctional riboflavin kinase/FAD synthetase [Candidatus Electrothrix aestuarii]|uniref:Riboflavin biosynthesis protein n=1 Tax=Candidatus Electrothrix aestuarii TaxID=3062594 RepID=A0AAU8LXW7_9BACT|nr:bifunctional riboflavin kinase/FAD synthetase [Candidatus Electrothrix aestuarii]
MQLYRSLDEIKSPFERPVVTIGNFDGVHLGHQLLFHEVAIRAKRSGGTSVAITFDPHPLKVLRPDGIRLISSTRQKIELIRMAGIDALLILPFDQKFAETTASDFVNTVLCNTIRVHELVVGYDYAFGKGREGNIDFLRSQGEKKGFPVTIVEAHYEEDMLVSSTKIRELVMEGRMDDVRNLLGRCYHIHGEVQRGKQRGGSEIGFPTANLKLSEEDLCPKKGVYVTQVIYDDKMYGSVTNIGYNPTFAENELVAETHIFDFNKDIYGHPIHLNVLRYLRGEVKFNSIQELSAQIKQDVAIAKQVLADAAKERVLSCEERFNTLAV